MSTLSSHRDPLPTDPVIDEISFQADLTKLATTHQSYGLKPYVTHQPALFDPQIFCLKSSFMVSEVDESKCIGNMTQSIEQSIQYNDIKAQPTLA